MVDDFYKPIKAIYKFLFSQSIIFQQFTQTKYKPKNLDIIYFLL